MTSIRCQAQYGRRCPGACRALLTLLLSTGLLGCSEEAPNKTPPEGLLPTAVGDAAGGELRDIDWEALIPADFSADALLADFPIEELDDDDPKAAEFMDRIRSLGSQAPVRPELDGSQVRISGFVVPLEDESPGTFGFLLVPYYGACIHVPPPPANQTLHVQVPEHAGQRPALFDVVQVSGTLQVRRTDTDLAEAGYTLYATSVVPHE